MIQRKIDDETDLPDCPGYWDESAKKLYKIIDCEIDDLIQFMDQDCTEEEFLFLSEISPECSLSLRRSEVIKDPLSVR